MLSRRPVPEPKRPDKPCPEALVQKRVGGLLIKRTGGLGSSSDEADSGHLPGGQAHTYAFLPLQARIGRERETSRRAEKKAF